MTIYSLSGSVVDAFGHRFRITGADLAVYRYMEANPEKFRPESIEKMCKRMVLEGLLNEEIKDLADFKLRNEGCNPATCDAIEKNQSNCNK